MKRVHWFMVGVAFGATLTANAQDVPGALANCRAEDEDSARLACYDRLAESVLPAASSAKPAEAPTQPNASSQDAGDGSVTPAAPESPAAPQPATSAPAQEAGSAPNQEFGYRGGPLARAQAVAREEAERTKDTGNAEVAATVTEVARRARGELVVTLDNGQTWVQKTADAKFVVRNGDRVRIEAGTLGSYTMYRSDSRRGTRVTRVR